MPISSLYHVWPLPAGTDPPLTSEALQHAWKSSALYSQLMNGAAPEPLTLDSTFAQAQYVEGAMVWGELL
jgi:hypothetical protein